MKRFFLIVLLTIGLSTTASASKITASYSWTWADNDNYLHTYTVFTHKNLLSNWKNWKQAFKTAKKKGGQLATITSQDELNAMTNAIESFKGFSGEFWLDGIQKTKPRKENNWVWKSSKEDFDAPYFIAEEPSGWNTSKKKYLSFSSDEGWQWILSPKGYKTTGFIMETITPIPNPEPGTLMLLGFGLLCVARIGRTNLSAKA